jgi:hypothetical protein
MKVKHKITGKIHTVSDDYFSKYEDRLEVLEVVEEVKATKANKPKKNTKVVTDDAPAVSE